MPNAVVVIATIYLVTLNVATLYIFYRDKQAARTGDWRVSEGTLLQLALFCGWPAMKLGQRWLRHKTRKLPFAGLLNIIVGLHIVIGGLIFYIL